MGFNIIFSIAFLYLRILRQNIIILYKSSLITFKYEKNLIYSLALVWR